MRPSAFYADEEKTYAGGFVYRVTTSGVNSLYSRNDDIDESIAYTTPKGNSHFGSMCMGGWNNNSDSAYVDKQLWFNKDYGSNSHSNVNMLTVSKHSFSDYGNTTVCFMSSPSNYYLFGTGAEATSTKGSMSGELITDFEVNKIVFGAGLLTGWTKADFEDFIENGSLADNDGYNISFSDFMANPSGYYIRTFDPVARGYWDGSTWKANNLSNSPNIKPIFMTNNSKTKGFLALNKHNFDSAQGTGTYGVHNINCFNTSASNATAISAYQIGSIYSELKNQGFILAETPGTLMINPDLTGREMMDLTGDGVIGADTTLPATDIFFADGIRTLKYDQYTLTADSGSSGPSHFSRYYYYFCHGMYGEYLYKLFAYMGVYFYTGSLADLNSSGATPENMAVTGMLLGEMDADGCTTGRWIGPDAMPDYQGINKGGSIVHPGYNPKPRPTGTDEDNNDPITTTGAPFADGICHYYAMTAGSPLLQHISEALGTWDIDTSKKDLYRNLISCKLIKPPAPIPTSGSEAFTIYGVKPQYQGADISLPVINGNPENTFGPYNIGRKFGDFRDFAPYTKCEIYLPYCGWCALPSHVVGRSVTVKYFTDIIAATCKAVVFCGANIIAEAAGVIGLDIPFAAENVGAKMAAVNSALLATAAGGVQLASGIGSSVATKSGSGLKGAASGLSQYISGYSQMAMAFNENWTEISGKNGDGCALAGAANIIIKITRPKYGSSNTYPYVPAGYAHNVGYVSNKEITLGSTSGLVVCDNADTSGISGATDAERAEIKRVLETGIYVNSPPE